jgi:NDP-sugar pyrophosphorylase family protein
VTGGLNFDEAFILKRVVESRPLGTRALRGKLACRTAPVWYNAGIYIFNPSLFDFTVARAILRGEYELNP